MIKQTFFIDAKRISRTQDLYGEQLTRYDFCDNLLGEYVKHQNGCSMIVVVNNSRHLIDAARVSLERIRKSHNIIIIYK